ncbi:hypothetical protein L0664_03005 [Octadecabacter sp. G9-8]|uniref:Uncharacterized protein n=1 Tax=Octadecabacter dasysiphoniae TaxID=2909341 RepID=A0ABS9CSV2_9RHOB|nr:hypothetical protein [Octadecabacter dasysiphoniae]MCF2870026.1 hypothetical protein [Octadecabacter dasysiphoniae]
MSDAKPLVVASLEDDTGDRCVDILKHADDHFTYVECRRDPEDNHGWRRLNEAEGRMFKTEYAAYVAATRDVDWLLD